MRIPEFKVQPTNAFCATINQILGGLSQLPTTASSMRDSELANLDPFFFLIYSIWLPMKDREMMAFAGGPFSGYARNF